MTDIPVVVAAEDGGETITPELLLVAGMPGIDSVFSVALARLVTWLLDDAALRTYITDDRYISSFPTEPSVSDLAGTAWIQGASIYDGLIVPGQPDTNLYIAIACRYNDLIGIGLGATGNESISAWALQDTQVTISGSQYHVYVTRRLLRNVAGLRVRAARVVTLGNQ